MLTIRPEHIQVFCERSRARFVDLMVAEVRQHWPDLGEDFGTERTRVVVDAYVTAALNFGFDTEYDAGRFVHLAFAFRTLSFTTQSWAEDIMNHEDLPARIRMNRLYDAALSQMKALERDKKVI